MSGDCFDQLWGRLDSECLEILKKYIDDGFEIFLILPTAQTPAPD